MSLSIAKKIVASTLVGTVAPVSWAAYKWSTDSEFINNLGSFPFLSSPSLKRFKGLQKNDYPDGTFAAKQVEENNGKYYLDTGSENKEVWEEVFKILEEKSINYQKIKSPFGITSGFSDNKNGTSLNGRCEELYKKKSEEGEKDVGWSWICSPGNMIVEGTESTS